MEVLPWTSWTLFKLCLLALSTLQRVLAANVTVDDHDAGFSWSSDGGTVNWAVQPGCTGCTSNPTDTSQIHGGTWHDATILPGGAPAYFESTFKGTAVYVYGMIGHVLATTTGSITKTDITLTVDGQKAATFTHSLLSGTSYQYQVPMLVKEGLADTQHTIRVELADSSNFLFDYYVYTVPDATSITTPVTPSTSANTLPASLSASVSTSGSSSSLSSVSSASINSQSQSQQPSQSISISSSTGNNQTVGPIQDAGSSQPSSVSTAAIAGIVVGVVGLLALLALCFLMYRRKQRTAQGYQVPHGVSWSTFGAGAGSRPQTAALTAPQPFSDNAIMMGNYNSQEAPAAASPFSSSGTFMTPDHQYAPYLDDPTSANSFMPMNAKQRRTLPPSARPLGPRESAGWPAARSNYSGSRSDDSRDNQWEDSSTYPPNSSLSSGREAGVARTSSTSHDRGSPGIMNLAAPGVGGVQAPWNQPRTGTLVAPTPVPLGVMMGGVEQRSASGFSSSPFGSRLDGRASAVTAPPPYYRSPPPATPFSDSQTEYRSGSSPPLPSSGGELSSDSEKRRTLYH